MLRFSPRMLLGATAISAFGIYAMTSGAYWPRQVLSFGLLVWLSGVTLSAIFSAGLDRAFCIGAALAGWWLLLDSKSQSATPVHDLINWPAHLIYGSPNGSPAYITTQVLRLLISGVASVCAGYFSAYTYRKYHE